MADEAEEGVAAMTVDESGDSAQSKNAFKKAVKKPEGGEEGGGGWR